MAVDIPSIEPTVIYAGDTIAWTKDLSDFPATTYTLTYYLRGPSNITIIGTASGSTHSISKTATQSAAWPSGRYTWQAFVTSGSARYLVGSGEITIKDNPATSKATFETRSKAKQILDAIENTILEAAGRPEASYNIAAGGISQQFKTLADLIVARDRYAAIVKQEEDALKITRGENTGRNIFVRFT